MTETRKGAVRIAANYARLGSNVLFGLWAVPILLGSVGKDAFGVIALLGATVGIAAMVQQIVAWSLIRELGSAHHAGKDAFRGTYNASILICLAASVVTAGLFAVVWLIEPLLEIPDVLDGAARLYVIAKGAETCWFVALAPMHRAFVITERMVLHNIGLSAEKILKFLAAILLVGSGITDPARGIVFYGWVGAVLYMLALTAQAAASAAIIPAFRPRLSAATRAGALGVVHVGKWNVAILVAGNLHLRFSALLVNLFFGIGFSALFGIANTLSAYVKMVTAGMTEGVDAVAARVSADRRDGASGGVARLMRHSTRLHALAALPAGVGMWFLAEPLLRVWVGGKLDDPKIYTDPAIASYEHAIELTTRLIQVLVVGLTARAISDGWLRVLYGAGFVRQAAPVSILAGILNPALGIALILALPEGASYLGPAVSYTAVHLLFHLLVVPAIAARCLDVRTRDMFVPMLGPATVTLLCTPLLVLAHDVVPRWTWLTTGAVIGAFGAVYAALSFWIVLTGDERRRLAQFALRRVGRGDLGQRAASDPARGPAAATWEGEGL